MYSFLATSNVERQGQGCYPSLGALQLGCCGTVPLVLVTVLTLKVLLIFLLWHTLLVVFELLEYCTITLSLLSASVAFFLPFL